MSKRHELAHFTTRDGFLLFKTQCDSFQLYLLSFWSSINDHFCLRGQGKESALKLEWIGLFLQHRTKVKFDSRVWPKFLSLIPRKKRHQVEWRIETRISIHLFNADSGFVADKQLPCVFSSTSMGDSIASKNNSIGWSAWGRGKLILKASDWIVKMS